MWFSDCSCMQAYTILSIWWPVVAMIMNSCTLDTKPVWHMHMQACTQHMHTTHAHNTCTQHMHTTHAHSTCTQHMHTTHAHSTCTQYMHTAHAHTVADLGFHEGGVHKFRRTCAPVKIFASHAHFRPKTTPFYVVEQYPRCWARCLPEVYSSHFLIWVQGYFFPLFRTTSTLRWIRDACTDCRVLSWRTVVRHM